MEVERRAQEPGRHALSLLASLNLQREQAQFCDCVVRLRQNPGQLHPAHRCVLAASSPVLSSISSSPGALVELHAPCLSDAVLALLLDYIYTGVLPCSRNRHQYSNLLTAAGYLQMDELQQTLRAWHQTEVKAADNTNASTGAGSKYLPLSPEKEDHQYPANVDMCDDMDHCGTSTENGAHHCSRKDASILRNVNICCGISESTESVNATNCGQVTPQNLIENIRCMTEVHWVSGVDKEVQKDRFHSAGTEEELEKTVLICPAESQEEETSRAEKRRPCSSVKSKAEEKQTNRREDDGTHHSTSNLKDSVLPSQCPSSSSSSSPHPCCGAVSVIRHSSNTAILQLAEMPPMPPRHRPVSQASVSSSRTSNSRPGSAGSIVEGITTRHNHHHPGEQSQHHRNNKDHVGTQSWDYRLSPDRSDILKQDFFFSDTDLMIEQNDKHMRNGFSHITDDNVHTKHLRDDLVPRHNDFCHITRGLQYKTALRFDDFPSKRQRLDCFDCQNVWMATAAEEPSICSQDPRAVVSLPVQDSDSGSDSRCEDLCYKGEAKEEHSYSRRPAETGRQDGHCTLYGPETDWYPSLRTAKMSTHDAASSQHEHNSEYRDKDKSHSVDLCQSVSTTPESCLDSFKRGLSGFDGEQMPGFEITEPHLAFTMPVDHNMSDPPYSAVGPSYRGHLQYHCLPQEDLHLSQRYSGRNVVDAFASPGSSPLRQQHFAPGTTDQVLLLDISAKPTELLVANAFGQKERLVHGFGNNDEEQWNEETSVVGADAKYWVGETNVKEGKSVGKDKIRPGAKVIHKAGVMEGSSNTEDSGNQATTLTVCTPPSMPDLLQASMSSVLSVGIPATLSASVPTNISAHLSTTVQHPFQCSLCRRSFSQRGSLNRHVRSHLGVRPFPCPCCPMTFSRQYRVTEHMRVHQRCVLRNDFQKPPASSI